MRAHALRAQSTAARDRPGRRAGALCLSSPGRYRVRYQTDRPSDQPTAAFAWGGKGPGARTGRAREGEGEGREGAIGVGAGAKEGELVKGARVREGRNVGFILVTENEVSKVLSDRSRKEKDETGGETLGIVVRI